MFTVLLCSTYLPTDKISKISDYSGTGEGLWRPFFPVFCFFACQVASLLMPLKTNSTQYIEMHSALYSINTPSQQKNTVI